MRSLALVLLLIGCGAKHAPKTYQVQIKGMQFVPAELTVDVGDTVVWTNDDVLPHTVTSGSPAAMPFDSKEIASKQRWQWTIGSAGEYAYGCTYHPTMHARLIAR